MNIFTEDNSFPVAEMNCHETPPEQGADPQLAALVLGYALFHADGFACLLQAHRSRLPTADAGTMAGAFLNMLSTNHRLQIFSCVVDALVEMSGEADFVRAMWNLSREMDSGQLAAIPGPAAIGLLADTVLKIKQYAAWRADEDFAAEAEAEGEASERFENLVLRLAMADENLWRNLEQACAVGARKEFEWTLGVLLDSCATRQPHSAILH